MIHEGASENATLRFYISQTGCEAEAEAEAEVEAEAEAETVP